MARNSTPENGINLNNHNMALTKVYSIEIEGQKAQATVGQLKEEIEKLEQQLDGVALGSAEADAAIRKLGAAKGALKELEDAVDALDPKAKTAALLDFANGFTGAFGVATVAAESFGLAAEGSMEKYEAKLLSVITVMQGVEAIHKSLNSETQSVLKSVLTMGGSWTIAGVKAKLFGTTTRTALTSTGILVFIVLLGTVIAHWDTITKKVSGLKESFARNFPAITGFVDTLLARLRDVASFLSFGLIDDSVTAAVKAVEEKEKAATEARIARRKRLIAEEEAAGKSTYNLKQQQLADELKLLEKGTEEYADKLSEIRQLKAAHDKSLAERDEKAWAEALAKEKAASEKALKAAEEAYAKRRELEGAALEAERAAREEARKWRLEQAKSLGSNTQQLLRVEIDNITDMQAELLASGKRFTAEYLALENEKRDKEKAIVAANLADRKKAKEEKQRLLDEELAALQEASDIAVIELKLRGAAEREITEATIQGLEQQLEVMEKAGLARTKAFAELKLQVQELRDTLVPKENDLMSKILTKLFRVDPDVLDEVKESLAESLASLQQSLGYMAETLFNDAFMRLDAYTQYLDEQLELTRERQDAAEDALQESMQRRAALESKLEDARGAKREYLIQQISKERAAEARLTAEKKKAAAEEANIAKQKEQAEEKRQQLEAKAQALMAATTLATNVQNAALAVKAALEAVAQGSKIPFPANIVAIAAGVAAVAAAVLSAKKLATSLQTTKMANGGALDGPSHDAGGIQGTGRFSNIEVEGGEFVTNKHAYRNNREAIERINAIGRSVRFVAIPEHQLRRKFAEGGQLPDGVTTGAQVAVRGDTALSTDELAAIRSVLLKIEANTAEAAKNKPGYIGPWESRQIVNQAHSLDRDEAVGKLL